MNYKYLVFILFTSSLVNQALASEVKVQELLDTIGITKFTNSIKRIKKYKSIEEIDELDYELKPYYSNLKLWFYFDEEGFSRGLKSKLKKNFTYSELNQIIKTFKKPFNLKVLNALALRRDVFKFNHQSVLTDESPTILPKSRYSLIKNIYTLNGMSIQNDIMMKRQLDFIESGRTNVAVINKKDGTKHFVNPSQLKKRYEKKEEYFITSLASELGEFRHYELREYLRVMKKSITNQKFLQIYINYYYLYLTEYMYKVHQDKLNAIKVLDNPPESNS
jgi:hypothetical protein